MRWLRIKLGVKKAWLWAKKFWWLIVILLGLVITFLIFVITKNGAFTASLLDLLDIKRNAHDAEMETLSHIHNTEVSEKNERLKEHQKRLTDLEEELAKKNIELDKEKKAELKRLVDEGYNDPEKLSREIARAFGLEYG